MRPIADNATPIGSPVENDHMPPVHISHSHRFLPKLPTSLTRVPASPGMCDEFRYGLSGFYLDATEELLGGPLLEPLTQAGRDFVGIHTLLAGAVLQGFSQGLPVHEA